MSHAPQHLTPASAAVLAARKRRRVVTTCAIAAGVIAAVFLFRFILILLVVAAVFSAYWAPSIVARRRGVPNRGSVIVINLLLGWTLIGWAVALAMACREAPPRPPHAAGPRSLEASSARDAANRFASAYEAWERDDPATRDLPPSLEDFIPAEVTDLTPNDAAYLRMIASAPFAPGQVIALPSGRTVTGAQLARWLAENS